MAVIACAPADARAEGAPPAGEPPRVAQIDVSPKVSPLPSPQTPTPRTAPGTPPPVPDPSIFVLGGTPQNPDFAVKPLDWKWKRFGTSDYVIALSAGAITLGTAIASPFPRHSLSGGILFDDSVRNSLRARDTGLRYTTRDASDVGLSLLATWPFFIDSLLTAWWYRGSRDAAQEMALIDLETLAISGAVQGTTNVLVSRERPYGQTCGTADLPTQSSDCQSSNHYRSFFSGHVTFGFTSAALMCLNHEKNELLGEPWDKITCAGGYAVASATSFFRITSDFHYATDVLTGAAVGTLIGYGVPYFHYKRPNWGVVRTGVLEMRFFPTPTGAGVVGSF